MTKSELERLAVLETQVGNIYQKVDSSDKKLEALDGKVDALLLHNAKQLGVLALFGRVAPWAAIFVSAVALVRS